MENTRLANIASIPKRKSAFFRVNCSSAFFVDAAVGKRVFTALALMLSLHLSAHAQTPPEGMSPEVFTQIQAIFDDKATLTDAQKKLDSQLVYAARAARGQPAVRRLGGTSPQLHDSNLVDAAGFTTVDITTTDAAGLSSQIQLLGGTVISAFPQYNAVRASVPVALIEALAGDPSVKSIRAALEPMTNRFITPPRAPFEVRSEIIRAQLSKALGGDGGDPSPQTNAGTGTRVSEAVLAHGADIVQNAGVTGAGVRICVISDGAATLSARQAAGEIPAVTILSTGLLNSSGDEGTAMLELVADMAPGATLGFSTGNGGKAQFAQNIRDLRNVEGCNIIVDDLTYSNEAAFQEDIIANAVTEVVNNGALYFSSAANSGHLSGGQSGTWEGDFVSAGYNANLSGTMHSFGANPYNSLTANTLGVNLKWSDPIGGSANDYDLYVLDSTGNTILGQSNSVQSGTQDPYESASCTSASCPVSTGGQKFFPSGAKVYVVQYSGASRALRVDTQRGRLSVGTSGSTFGHNGGVNTVSVAAVSNGNLPISGRKFIATDKIATYSSDGPRKLFLNPVPATTYITTGCATYGCAGGGGTLLPKVDIAAADCNITTNTTTSNGTLSFNPFCGTSAAAPQAAAIAALIKSSPLNLPYSAIISRMKSAAIDIMASGSDVDSGAGIVMADAALMTNVTLTSAPAFGAYVIVSGTGCNSGSYYTPITLPMVRGASCTFNTFATQAGSTGTQYVFNSWLDNGSTNNVRTVVLLDYANLTYTAGFATQYQLTTAASPVAAGTVSPGSGVFYTAGTTVNLNATPNPGYRFTSWLGNVAAANSAATQITLYSPQSVTGNFAASSVSCSIGVSPGSIANGSAAYLTWSSSGATSGSISSVGNVQLSGTLAVAPSSTTTYLGTFTGPGGAGTCSATLTVIYQQPTCSISATPSTINYGSSSILIWSSQYATTGSITGVGGVAVSGSASVTPSATTTYTGTFNGLGGNGFCSATISVNQLQQTITFTSQPPAIKIPSGSYLVTASATSGLPISFTLAPGSACTIAGATVTFTTLGTCAINANQPGNANYSAAPQSQQGVIIPLINEIPVAGANSLNLMSAGPGGAVWVAVNTGNSAGEIQKIAPDGVVTHFPVSGGGPMGIAAGADGNVWFTTNDTGKVGRMTPGGGVTLFTPQSSGSLGGITAGPDSAMWFVNTSGARIGRIDIGGSNTISEFVLPPGSTPQIIVTGADGALWFSESGRGRIGRISATGVLTEFSLPMGLSSNPVGIVAGPDGALWFVEQGANNVGRLTTGGVVTEYLIPGGSLQNIAAGPDGALWFTTRDDKINRMSVGGVVTQFTTATSGGSNAVTAGSDGGIWFTEVFSGKVGRITPPSDVTRSLATVADFDGSQPLKSELLWRGSNGDVRHWTMTTTSGITLGADVPVTSGGVAVTSMTPNWKLLARGKFDGDARADLLWRDSNTSQLWLWLMNGPAVSSAARVALSAQLGGGFVDMPPNWTLMTTGDFDANGSIDLLWRDSISNQLWLWSMSGSTITSSVRVTLNNTPVDMPADWVLLGSGDFNNDGKTDLLWRNASTSQLWLWSMNGAAITNGVRVTYNSTPVDMPGQWTLMTTGSFTSPTVMDLLWRDASNGQLWLWSMNGASIVNSVRVTYNGAPVDMPAVWALQGSGDLDGDNKPDIVWRNVSSGDSYAWKMNGAAIVSSGSLGIIP